jgi:hypothetical protein
MAKNLPKLRDYQQAAIEAIKGCMTVPPEIMRPARKPTRITDVRPVDENHRVVSVIGGGGQYRREPCGGCPWRVDQTGTFPAGAFRETAGTAYDRADKMFSCHESGTKKPATCAGFLMRGADDNLAVRMKYIKGEMDFHAISDGGHELHESYRAMAEANGVDPSDPILAPCR